MISIGAIYSGPELEGGLADRLISHMQSILYELVGSYEVGGEAPGVNVVFCVPGSLRSPDWEWIREGDFSRRLQLLAVQVAIPRDKVDAPSLKDFLIESLHGANAVAFEFFRQKGIQFPLADAEALVHQVKDRLNQDID